MGALRGVWVHVTPEKFEILILSKAILVFGEGDFFLKRSLNRLFFMPIFFCMFSHTSTQFYFIFQAVYLSFLGISFKYTLLHVLVYHKNSFENILNRCQNRDFSYPNRILVRIWDF